jgi:hypothetical protein
MTRRLTCISFAISIAADLDELDEKLKELDIANGSSNINII